MVLSFIGWRDFPLDKDDTWEPITNLPGSEHMIAEFQKSWEEEYKIKTSEQLQSLIDKRNTRNEKNAKTQRDRMRMGQGAGVMGQPHTPNGDRFAVFTSQQEQ